jgi:hypothetical protein
MTSDEPPWPGWWIASDGNWYPPERHPDRRRQLPPPPVGAATPATIPSSATREPATDVAPRRSGSPFRRWWFWVLCAAVVAAGVGAVVVTSHNASSSVDTGSSSTTVGGDRTTTTSPPTTSSSTTPMAGSAMSDVTVVACEIDPNDARLVDIAGRITNSTSQAQDYSINLLLFEGPQQVGTASGNELDVAAGQVTAWSSFGALSSGRGGKVSCVVTSVNRTPAQP